MRVLISHWGEIASLDNWLMTPRVLCVFQRVFATVMIGNDDQLVFAVLQIKELSYDEIQRKCHCWILM